jgi:4-amino-4-deoxy-L-arabinose transferase-like glycosyltransferase
MTEANDPLSLIPKRPQSTLWMILVLWVIFYASFTLFTPPLLDDADSVHAEVAREMLTRHDWITLYANGIRYLEKAPLLYWSMALSFALFGAHPAAARLPLAFAVLALALVSEAFARRAFRSVHAGLYAALILLSSFGIFIFSRITLPDVMVCLWLSLAILCFWLLDSQPIPNRLLCYGFATCCALNVLTKGLIGVVFPIAIAAAYLLILNGPRAIFTRIRNFHPLSSTIVFLTLSLPWHILIGLANPTQGHPGEVRLIHGHWTVPLPTDGNVHGWTWFYFVNEQILRYLNLRVPRDYDTVPLVLFYCLVFVWLMPFSAFLPVAVSPLKTLWRSIRLHEPLSPQQRASLLFMLWAAIVLLFFSLSTRQEYYVLPALPALALLISSWLSDESRNLRDQVIGRRIVASLAIAGGLAAAIALFFVLTARPLAPGADLATLLSQNPADYALSFGHFLDLSAASMGVFRLPLLLATVAFSAGPIAAWWIRRQGNPHRSNLALFAATFVFLLAAHIGLRTFAPVLSSKQLADAIAPQLRSEDLIVLNGEYEAGSTLGFYLHRQVHILNGRSSNLWYGSFFPDAPRIFETDTTIARRWQSSQRIFLWQDLSALNRKGDGNPLPPLDAPIYVLAKGGGKEILSNQPNH